MSNNGKKPTKEEYFKKKAEEHAREYRIFFEGLSEWEVEFVKKYDEGIDGHPGLYVQELLQMVSERVKKAHQAGYEEAVEEMEKEIRLIITSYSQLSVEQTEYLLEAIEQIRLISYYKSKQ